MRLMNTRIFKVTLSGNDAMLMKYDGTSSWGSLRHLNIRFNMS